MSRIVGISFIFKNLNNILINFAQISVSLFYYPVLSNAFVHLSLIIEEELDSMLPFF